MANLDLPNTRERIRRLEVAPPGTATSQQVELNVGSHATRGGKVTFPVDGGVVGSIVVMAQARAVYTGKGTMLDEGEMDVIFAQGVVTSPTEATVNWTSSSSVRGNVVFNYTILKAV